MTKEDWIKVIKNTFNDGTKKSLIDNGKLTLSDEKYKTTISLPKCSKVYTIENDLDEIQICTKETLNNHSADSFSGTHIIVSKNLEICMLASTLSVNYIPWTEISVITTEYHPESI